MGCLHWRENSTRFGCQRGWLRLAGLAAFVLAGYFALYAWLRATDAIEILHWDYGPYIVIKWVGSATNDEALRIDSDGGGKWPRSMRTMRPAMKLEVALDRRGWRPGGSMPKGVTIRQTEEDYIGRPVSWESVTESVSDSRADSD